MFGRIPFENIIEVHVSYGDITSCFHFVFTNYWSVLECYVDFLSSEKRGGKIAVLSSVCYFFDEIKLSDKKTLNSNCKKTVRF